jgi:arginyl-tRNA synthetase
MEYLCAIMAERIENRIREATAEAVETLFGQSVDPAQVAIKRTPKEFAGQYTVVVFPYVRMAKKSPEETGAMIAGELLKNVPEIDAHNQVKGFLNLELSTTFWCQFLDEKLKLEELGRGESKGEVVVLEYCGPNTNKPLHVGHIRNMLLGYSTAELLSAAGYEVHKVNIYNDRGIAICKSMAAYLTTGGNKNPDNTGIKGDRLVGDFYVEYNRIASEESQPFIDQGMDKREAEKQSAIFNLARDLLLKWEAGDEETLALWREMNSWVYAGFNETYAMMGIDFEKDYLESEHYLAGKVLVEAGVDAGVFYKHEDGSVRADMSDDGLDEKLLLRSDGSSMYITQDLGVAEQRYADYSMDRSIYVVGSEQDYHFKVLKVLLQKLGKDYAKGIEHLSYGMVDLPAGMGRMKSREGTTVDADDLIASMIEEAREESKERGKVEGMSDEEQARLHRMVALGALKYFILKVDPRKRIVFNPKESISLQGDTGPFVQYTYARIQSILRKAGEQNLNVPQNIPILERKLMSEESTVLSLIARFSDLIQDAAENRSPAEIANFCFELAKSYNKFFQNCPVLKAENQSDQEFRLGLSLLCSRVIAAGFSILGIEVPNRM